MDYVTNSSSASYLIVFKTPGWSEEEVIDELKIRYEETYPMCSPWQLETEKDREKYTKEYEKGREEDLKTFSERASNHLRKLTPGVFQLHESTCMHNSWTDGLPEYLQEFVFSLLSRKGFEVLSLEMTDES
jgi:hypothetical protein